MSGDIPHLETRVLTIDVARAIATLGLAASISMETGSGSPNISPKTVVDKVMCSWQLLVASGSEGSSTTNVSDISMSNQTKQETNTDVKDSIQRFLPDLWPATVGQAGASRAANMLHTLPRRFRRQRFLQLERFVYRGR